MINNEEKNYISAIVYVHNHEKIIKEFLKKIDEGLQSFSYYEIIIVNDVSCDKSIDIIHDIVPSLRTTAITIINMGFFHGLESSMRAGVDLSIGDFVYEFDDLTLSYDKNLIFKLYEKSLQGYDIVSESNKNSHKGSKLFYKIFNRFSNYTYKLKSESFMIISRRWINRVKSMNISIPYRKAVYANCGLKSETIYYEANVKRINDHNQLKMRKSLAVDSLLLFTNFGYKISVFLTMIMMLVTILVTLYTVYIFVEREPVQGWVSTMLFLSFSFFSVFLIFTILIKYATLITDLLFKKEEYVIKSIEKITNSHD